jgi:hypothetical protein
MGRTKGGTNMALKVWQVHRGGYFLGDQEQRTKQIQQIEAEHPDRKMVEANDRQLYLDLDLDQEEGGFYTEEDVKRIVSGLVEDLFGGDIGTPRFLPSKSGNLHAIVRLRKPMPALERVAVQLALGSDPVRERISAQRVLKGISPAICLLLRK